MPVGLKPVGVLGGMGPDATILLMQKVLRLTNAQHDRDNIPLIVHQNPAVPSRVDRMLSDTAPNPAPHLIKMARDLEKAGAKALAMPCNIAHLHAAQIQESVDIPFLDIRDETIANLPEKARIGMLATPIMRTTKLFDAHFTKSGLTQIYLKDDTALATILQEKQGGAARSDLEAAFADLANALAVQSDHLLVACTDLSHLTSSLPDGAWTDSLNCLALGIIRFSRS